MAVAGKIQIDLEANNAKFSNTISEASSSLNKLGESSQAAESLLTGLGAGIGLGAFEALKAGAEAVFDVVKEGLTTIAEWTKQGLEATASAFRLSGALGITTGSLQALHAAGKTAGLGTEEVDLSLQRLAKTIGEASEKGGTVNESFQRIGLTGEELAGQRLDKSFRDVAEAIGEIHNPAERAAAVTEIFGKSGEKLLPLFANGAEAIDKATQMAQKFGLAISETDAAKVMAANEQFEQVGLAVEGVKEQLVVALAPALTGIATEIIKILPSASTFRSILAEIGEYGTGAIAALADYVVELKREWQLAGTVAVENLSQMLTAIDKVAHGVVSFLNILPGVSVQVPKVLDDATVYVEKFAAKMEVDLAKATNSPLPDVAILNWYNRVIADSDKAAKELEKNKGAFAAPIIDGLEDAAEKSRDILKSLEQEVEEFGLSAGEKAALKLSKLPGDHSDDVAEALGMAQKLQNLQNQKSVEEELRAIEEDVLTMGDARAKQFQKLVEHGATQEQLQEAQEWLDKMDEIKQKQKDQQEADKLWENARNPLQKYNDELEKLNNLLAEGALNEAQFAQAKLKADQELAKASRPEEKHAEALIRRFDFRLPSGTQLETDPKKLFGGLDKSSEKATVDPQQKFEVQKKQLDTAQKSDYSLGEMLRIIRQWDTSGVSQFQVVDF